MTGVDVLTDFRRIARAHPRCFWLDGGGARPWSGRQSVLGWLAPDDVSLSWSAARGEVVRHRGGHSRVVGEDIWEVLADEVARDGGAGEWVGWFGYPCRRDLPARVDRPDSTAGTPDVVPDAVWMRPSHVRRVDHPAGTPAPVGPPLAHTPARATGDVPPAYRRGFDAVQEALRGGHSYEVNLTYREEVAAALPPAEAYARLRTLNPAPYAGFVQHDVPGARGWLLSSSPERYATVDRHRRIQTRPIKGTTPRGATPAEDDRLRRHLAEDPKFRAENLMVVDLLRNDLAQVCEVGSVEVPSLMAVETYPSVHQLVSTVQGRLREDVTTVAALRSLFPAGSMTGAPKLRTMQVIEATETTPRGVYAGAFGWLAGDGRADLGVVIRSLTTPGDGRWRLGTGGGITVRSDPEEEYAETRWKAERLLAVLRDQA